MSSSVYQNFDRLYKVHSNARSPWLIGCLVFDLLSFWQYSRYAPARLVFLVARRRAFASGSIPAIHLMFKMIEYQEKTIPPRRLTTDQIRTQFELEFLISITPATMASAEKWTTPTAQELREEHSYLLQRQASVQTCDDTSSKFSPQARGT